MRLNSILTVMGPGTDSDMIFKLGELFCGPGGLGYAASQSKVNVADVQFSIEPTWATDIDEDACRTYDLNIHGGTGIENGKVIVKPVAGLNIQELPTINAFAFGFPCNDYSKVGERNGINGKYGPLYTAGVEVIDHHKPKWFVAENVSGLHESNNAVIFKRILADLSGAGNGYRLTVHRYRFEDYGVPQNRHRVIIVGIATGLGLTFKVPSPTTPEKPVTSREAIEEPPIPADAKNHEFARQYKRVIERLKHIPPGKNAWYEGIPAEHRLQVKKAHLSQIYKRLDGDKPAYTITGSGGGGTHTYHWKEPRALTNRERARLQTFPDEYEFVGRKERVRRQIGMAVPPHGAQLIFEAILKTFAGVDYDAVDSSHTPQGDRADTKRIAPPSRLDDAS